MNKIRTMNAILQYDMLKIKSGIFEPLPNLYYKLREEVRYNHNHDLKTGQFTSGDGAASDVSNSSAKSVDKSSKDAIIEHKDEIIADFKSTNFNGEIHIPPKEIDIEKLTIDSEHINKRGHNVSEEQAKQFINDAVVSYSKTVEGHNFENYIGYEGTAYVNIDTNVIRTAYSKSQFTNGTKRFLETLNKHTEKE